MDKLISKETEYELSKLGLYQIFGGTVGMIIIVWSIYKDSFLTELTVLIYLFILLFFAYSIFCGILCLKSKSNALGHSLTNQILQVISVAIMGFSFKYVAGLCFIIGLNLTDIIKFNFGVGISNFAFNLNNEKDRLEIDFNLIALAVIYWIDKLMKKVKEEKSVRETPSIGEE